MGIGNREVLWIDTEVCVCVCGSCVFLSRVDIVG